ncbi:hypothetical protein PROFUN_11838 [Planoprotostelium fungivorum]|uniref:Uncharacterized protein n=1 Tax=Planoprotostelium fungivorum TaxID=1890364 RepID=A0A2P6N9A2_9EUKA|nr:hypothetical protein PROFUN_11838 [Planoprotostelium fungivorum]
MSADDVISNQPVGSGILKAGLAGVDHPKTLFPSYVGRPKHTRVMAGSVEGDLSICDRIVPLNPSGSYFIGKKAEDLRGLLRIKYPMEHGIVDDWADMEYIWQYAYSEMRVQAEEHPVLLTEAPLNPKRNREKASEIFFETFNVPALFISIQAVLSLYASGRTTGVVLDSGDGVTHAVPIFEGFTLPHAIQRIDLAGRDVTNYLQRLMRRSGNYFYTSAERETVRNIKETSCYVALDPTKEEEISETEKSTKPQTFKLPDGNIIDLGTERFKAPELLFHPELIGEEYSGVHETLVYCIQKTDLDLRKTLYSNVVLSGGSTLFPGFGERLLNEVRHLAPKDMKIKISAPPDRKYSTWMGGSILASLTTFKKMWVSAQEYEEEGAAIIHRKTF